MGITVISTSGAPTAASSSLQVAATSGDALPSGFAALLSGQIGNPSELAAAAPSTAVNDSEEAETDSELPADLTASDPTLAFFAGLPPHIAPVATSNTSSLGLGKQANSEGTAIIGEEPGRLANIDSKAGSLNAEKPVEGNGQQESFAEALKLKTQAEPDMAANLAAETARETSSTQESAAALAAGNSAQKLATPSTNTGTEIKTPLHSADWSHSFGEKIVWLAKNDQQTAQININPPQLGPVQITLQMNGDQASAIFASPHAEVRQAIENSLPQLKEMLAGAGINLGQADVGANLAQQNREAPFQSANENRSAGENAILPGSGNTVDNTISTPVQRGRGLVDLFA